MANKSIEVKFELDLRRFNKLMTLARMFLKLHQRKLAHLFLKIAINQVAIKWDDGPMIRGKFKLEED